MSPSAAFSKAWEDIEPRLSTVLRARGCDTALMEDISQETALRLYDRWAEVRKDSVWSLAVTIALNLLRDSYRARDRVRFVDEVPDRPSKSDTETSALAKMELAHVADAMRAINPRYRSALLQLVDGGGDDNRMVRSRARKQLREYLGRVSAGVAALRGYMSRRGRELYQLDSSQWIGSATQTLTAALVVGVAALSPLAHASLESDRPGDDVSEVRTVASSDNELREVTHQAHIASLVPPRTAFRPPVLPAQEAYDGDTWTPVRVDETEVRMPVPQGSAATDGSRTEAEVEADAGGQHVERREQAEHEPPDCTARVSLDGDTAYHCEGDERP